MKPRSLYVMDVRRHVLRAAMLASTAFLMLASPTTAQTQSDQPFTVEADELLEWNQKAGTYSAKGNAIAKQGERKIEADKLTASYDPESESRKINVIVATGNVDYTDGTSTARGARLTYDLGNESYIVEGKNAYVTGPNGTMRATTSIDLQAADPKNQIITAIGAAQYVDSEGQVVEGETIIARLDDAGALDTLDATDRVKLVTIEGQIATGDNLAYDGKTEKALLTGNVEINDAGNVMYGSRAEVDFETGISRILSGGSGKRVSGTLLP